MFSFYKKYTNLDKALLCPSKVKKLHLSFLTPLEYEDKLPLFTSLKELSIHANIFDEPLGLEKLVKMESLERLEMLNVNYKDFPEQLCNLQNLKYLKIRGCDFKFIPDSIVRFKNLSNLSIENTDIITLPVVMKNMPGIKELSLRANWSLKISCNELPLNLEKLYISESIFGKEILEESQLLMPRLRVFYS